MIGLDSSNNVNSQVFYFSSSINAAAKIDFVVSKSISIKIKKQLLG